MLFEPVTKDWQTSGIQKNIQNQKRLLRYKLISSIHTEQISVTPTCSSMHKCFLAHPFSLMLLPATLPACLYPFRPILRPSLYSLLPPCVCLPPFLPASMPPSLPASLCLIACLPACLPTSMLSQTEIFL